MHNKWTKLKSLLIYDPHASTTELLRGHKDSREEWTKNNLSTDQIIGDRIVVPIQNDSRSQPTFLVSAAINGMKNSNRHAASFVEAKSEEWNRRLRGDQPETLGVMEDVYNYVLFSKNLLGSYEERKNAAKNVKASKTVSNAHTAAWRDGAILVCIGLLFMVLTDLWPVIRLPLSFLAFTAGVATWPIRGRFSLGLSAIFLRPILFLSSVFWAILLYILLLCGALFLIYKIKEITRGAY